LVGKIKDKRWTAGRWDAYVERTRAARRARQVEASRRERRRRERAKRRADADLV
jgi:hypothetical protein